MRRLYLQIYGTFVAILLLFLLLLAVAWAFVPAGAWQQTVDGAGAVIGELVIRCVEEKRYSRKDRRVIEETSCYQLER